MSDVAPPLWIIALCLGFALGVLVRSWFGGGDPPRPGSQDHGGRA